MKNDENYQKELELCHQLATSQEAVNEWARSRAEVILPLIQNAATVNNIFKYELLPPGSTPTYDVPFEDIDCVWMMSQIGVPPVVQVEAAELHLNTFGLDGGIELQMDVVKDGRVSILKLANIQLRNRFLVQIEMAGWNLVKAHAAVLDSAQQVTGRDDDGATASTKKMNIHTINEVITVADTLGAGGRRVTDFFMSPRRFGDLRTGVTMSALPEDMRRALWNNGQGADDTAEIRFHRVYNSALVDDDTAYAFTQKDGFYYGVQPVRDELETVPNPISQMEWKIGALGRTRRGFGVLDSLGLIEIDFS